MYGFTKSIVIDRGNSSLGFVLVRQQSPPMAFSRDVQRNLLALFILLILQCLVNVSRADISKQELQKWVDESPLTFTGIIVEMGA